LLASNRPRQRRLIAREKRHFVRQVETTSPRPVRRSGVSRAFAEHALRRGIEDEKFLVPVRYDHGITHVGQDRLENLVDLGEVACCVMPVHESLPYPTLVGNRKSASDLSRLQSSRPRDRISNSVFACLFTVLHSVAGAR